MNINELPFFIPVLNHQTKMVHLAVPDWQSTPLRTLCGKQVTLAWGDLTTHYQTTRWSEVMQLCTDARQRWGSAEEGERQWSRCTCCANTHAFRAVWGLWCLAREWTTSVLRTVVRNKGGDL